MFGEIPRVKFEKGKITIDIFTYNSPIPIYHIKGKIKDPKVREEIKNLKRKFGKVLFSDILDFIKLEYDQEDLRKELKEIFKNGKNIY